MPGAPPGHAAEPGAAGDAPRRARTRSLVLRATGYASLGLAGAGVVLPLLPTTPFLLLALWAFGRSSPGLARRLRRGRRFGPMLRDWEEGGAISRPAKRRALAVMALSWLWLAYAARDPLAIAAASLCMGGAAAFILARPSVARHRRGEGGAWDVRSLVRNEALGEVLLRPLRGPLPEPGAMRAAPPGADRRNRR